MGESEVSTIVIRGATSTCLQDVERAIDDGVNIVRAMTKNGKFVAGAGAAEIELSHRLEKYAQTIPGLEQVITFFFGFCFLISKKRKTQFKNKTKKSTQFVLTQKH